MKIIVRSVFESNERAQETSCSTLGVFLEELSNKYKAEGVLFFDIVEEKKVAPSYSVFLNEKPTVALAEGLNTTLHDGDKVRVSLFLVAGG